MDNQHPQLTKNERKELRRQEILKEQENRKRVRLAKKISFLFFALIGIVGIIFGLAKTANSPSQSSLPVDAASISDWTKGNRMAGVVLIEYSDFQCPACGSYYPVLKQLSQEFGDKILFVYRHFPLPNHKNAEPAARAAEAAGRQNKFWEMHDLIFENQKEWSTKQNAEEDFLKYAQSLNLDIAKFQLDSTAKETNDKIRNEYQNGIKAGVNATPTFFLNGTKLQNPRTYEEFKKIILEAIYPNPQ